MGYYNTHLMMKDEEVVGNLFGPPNFSLSSSEDSHWQDSSALILVEPDLLDIDTESLPCGIEAATPFLGHKEFFKFTDHTSFDLHSSSKKRKAPNTAQPTTEHEKSANGLWDPPEVEQRVKSRYDTWEAFHEKDLYAQSTCYLSEAGPGVLDAVLEEEADVFRAHSRGFLVVNFPIYVSSLLAMGLGRSSVLFSFSEEKQGFIQTESNLRVSGCTGAMMEKVRSLFITCGNIFRSLQQFIDNTYRQNSSSSRIALADATSALLRSLNLHLAPVDGNGTTLLQAQTTFRPAERLLKLFDTLVKMAISAKSDESLLSRLFDEVRLFEHRADSVSEILCEILSHVSRSFLDFTGEWIGIAREQHNLRMDKNGPGRSFVKTENRMWLDEQGTETSEPDFVLDTGRLPSFISEEDALLVFETGRSLRFLRTHHANHPLTRGDVIASANPPPLQWRFSWSEIEQIENKALQYERDLIDAIRQYSCTDDSLGRSSMVVPAEDRGMFDLFGKTEEETEARFLATMETVHDPLPAMITQNRLSDLIHQSLNPSTFSAHVEQVCTPPIALTSHLSFDPLVAAQARVVNSISMGLFFRSHHIRAHLSVLKRFQLLGDGVFSSRLSHALFDPDLETAERKSGIAHSGETMGLRLGTRDTWPPATSELRLALMGVLADSFTATEHAFVRQVNNNNYPDYKSALPGDLSFAVREMSDEEIAKCLNPSSIQALDFLRLSYKPPSPLEAVVTPLALYKYDQLFKFLLRVLRMLYVVNQLFRDVTDRTSESHHQSAKLSTISTRFRIESHHFITCISEYFFTAGITATWSIFEKKLDGVEAIFQRDDEFPILGAHEGIHGLRQYHERVLDRMLHTLLLRKRQRAVMTLLEEIFGSILEFAKVSRKRASSRSVYGGSPGDESQLADSYGIFRKKVGIFMIVCRNLSEKRGFAEDEDDHDSKGGLFDTADLKGENTILQLLGRLEMSGFY